LRVGLERLLHTLLIPRVGAGFDDGVDAGLRGVGGERFGVFLFFLLLLAGGLKRVETF
jgi:hypothetical protein